MTDCIECLELEKQLEQAAVEYFRATWTNGPDDEPSKTAERKTDEIQEQFDAHKATHGVALGSSAS